MDKHISHFPRFMDKPLEGFLPITTPCRMLDSMSSSSRSVFSSMVELGGHCLVIPFLGGNGQPRLLLHMVDLNESNNCSIQRVIPTRSFRVGRLRKG